MSEPALPCSHEAEGIEERLVERIREFIEETGMGEVDDIVVEAAVADIVDNLIFGPTCADCLRDAEIEQEENE